MTNSRIAAVSGRQAAVLRAQAAARRGLETGDREVPARVRGPLWVSEAGTSFESDEEAGAPVFCAPVRHCWVSMGVPADHATGRVFVGAEAMVSYEEPADLATKVQALIEPWGLRAEDGLVGLWADGPDDYSERLMRQNGYSWVPSGTFVSTTPCDSHGVNLDAGSH